MYTATRSAIVDRPSQQQRHEYDRNANRPQPGDCGGQKIECGEQQPALMRCLISSMEKAGDDRDCER
jgi:hypothetical protein